MEIGKKFTTCMLICAFVVMVSSCAKHSSVTNPHAANSGLETQNSSIQPQEMSVVESLGKTIVDFPLDIQSQVYAEYDQHENIIVSFVPPTPDFIIPLNDTSLVRCFEKKFDGDKIKSLSVMLNSKTKFLLSKQGDSLGRLMLVAENKSAPILPKNVISSLSFKSADGSLQIVTYSSLPFEIIPEQNGQFKIYFDKAFFKDSLLKNYDVSKLGSSVQSVVARNDEGGNACLVISGPKNPPLSVLRKGDETRIVVKSDGVKDTPPIKMLAAKKDGPSVNPEDVEDTDIQELNTLFPGMKESYTGQKISIDIQDADLEHVLRLISEVSGYNLILDEDILGKISLKLVDIPWDQALDLILLQKNLGMVLKGNIMRIASTSRLEAERAQLQKAREAAIQAKVSMQNLAPLKTEYIQINYNTAADFEGKVKALLTSRGTTSADSRTNILIVTDTEETLRRVKSFIKKLDRAERQVLIEARLVYATDEFQRSLGIQWGTKYDTETSANSASEQYRGGLSTTGMNMLNTVNGITLAGEIGKYLGEDLFTLDASLQLGETKNLVKTISSPRILTLNNNRAEIQQGTKLATATESESGGTTTEYEEAVLKISVLPQITPDNKLILDLDISDDSPKSDGRDIDTKQTKTKMMVNDRETIVIGGVQKSTETSGINQIPGLGDVPGLGWLFKHDYKTKNKAELLIFIHPRIL